MISSVKSIGLTGLDGFVVDVETDISTSDNLNIEIIGLPDAAVKESKERINTVIM